MELIVTEKPSVARDFVQALPDRFNRDDAAYISHRRIITWCIGHVARLAYPSEYRPEWENWAFEHLPMIPDEFALRPSDHTRDHWTELSRWLTDSRITRIINGCDAGREGELIFRRAYRLAGATAPVQRLWLSSMTKTAIRAAFDDLRPAHEYEDLFAAARSRATADWLIGLNGTRAMTLAARRHGIQGVKSVGRVQTPTLAILVERERELRDFTPTSFWNLFATLQQDDSTVELQLQTDHGKNRIWDEERARNLKQQLPTLPAEITDLDTTKQTKRPPLLYDLSSLQQDANSEHGYTAQQTLDAAQKLYEAGALTYPRTDSRHLTADMKPTLHDRVHALDSDPWSDPNLDDSASAPLPHTLYETAEMILDATGRFPPPDHIFDDGKVTDHHAIIPTTTPIHDIDVGERAVAIYELVQRRYLQQFLGAAEYLVTTVDALIGDLPFRTKGKQLLTPGWRTLSTSDDEDTLLPSLSTGPATIVDTCLHDGKTQPPRRYTESRLLKAMENAGKELDDDSLRGALKEAGLGTPATRASIIETLLDRNYVIRSGNHIVPTDDGEALIASLPDSGLTSPTLTAQWELALQRIAQGELDSHEFMTKVRQLTTSIVHEIRSAELHFTSPDHLGPCPLCDTPVTPRKTVYTCQTGRDCSFLIGKNIADRVMKPDEIRGILENGKVGPLNGFVAKNGQKFSASLYLDDSAQLQFSFD